MRSNDYRSMESVLCYIVKNPGVPYQKMIMDLLSIGYRHTDNAIETLMGAGMIKDAIEGEDESSRVRYLWPSDEIEVDRKMKPMEIRKGVSKIIREKFPKK